jgi:pimeloyl-ACP methyl ester carboxylesterase
MIYTAIVGLLASAATAFPTLQTSSHLRQRQYGANETVSNFMDIPSSTELNWVPCYERFQCANLEVPLDYKNLSIGNTVVAWIRLEGANSTGRDILFNPGGPGGSGIRSFLTGTADEIMKVTGGKYNAVSFDPRGVNASAIDLTCFADDETRDNYKLQEYPTNAETFAGAVAVNEFCTAFNENTDARYASTMAVVQDMIHFTELQATLNGEKAEEALVYYYGVSYGTVIGQTLANLFPERVGRIVLDSNVNAENFYKGIDETAISDTDKGMIYFFNVCAEAGEKKCAFARNSSNAEELENRFNALLDKLEIDPIKYFDLDSSSAGIITRNAVLRPIFNWLYTPSTSFIRMANALAAAEDRNATAWFVATKVEPSDNSGPFNYTEMASQLTLRFVTGLDSAGRSPLQTLDAYEKSVAVLNKTSKWFGEGYAKINPLSLPGFGLVPPPSQIFPGKSPNNT